MVDGIEEIVQQIIFRLTIPKGSFDLDPQLGSDIRSLRNVSSKEINQMAFTLVEQAIMPMDINSILKEVECTSNGEGALDINISLDINSKDVYMEVKV